MQQTIQVKGMILRVAPQGEYGRRLDMITDRLGRITAFAKGAGKVNSRIIGCARPFVCAEFTLMKGRTAWNLYSVKLIDGFSEFSFELGLEGLAYGNYVLEAGGAFAAPDMPEEEAKMLLNLMFVTLCAIRDKSLPFPVIKSIYELRLLKLSGEYSAYPGIAGSVEEQIWNKVLSCGLKSLYVLPEGTEDLSSFCFYAEKLFEKQVPQRFHSLQILHEPGL